MRAAGLSLVSAEIVCFLCRLTRSRSLCVYTCTIVQVCFPPCFITGGGMLRWRVARIHPARAPFHATVTRCQISPLGTCGASPRNRSTLHDVPRPPRDTFALCSLATLGESRAINHSARTLVLSWTYLTGCALCGRRLGAHMVQPTEFRQLQCNYFN